jgi:hypothetical protein
MLDAKVMTVATSPQSVTPIRRTANMPCANPKNAAIALALSKCPLFLTTRRRSGSVCQMDFSLEKMGMGKRMSGV